MKNCIFVVLALIFCLPIMTSAQQSVNSVSPEAMARITPEADLSAAVDALAAGVAEGQGTHFALSNSGYIDVVLDSTDPVAVRLTSSPELVTMHFEASADKASTQITLRGFKPATIYYKYEDNYHNKEQFTTDDAGTYVYQQDLSSAHLVYIQPRKSTKFISDNTTGGDCATIGIWDASTKTCTLTMDLSETVQIDSNDITLDGNGHSITGTGTGFGIYLPGRTGVTVKRARVSNFGDGIYLRLSSGCTISGNTVSSNTAGPYYGGGINLDNSSNNTVTGNTAANNSNCGISSSFSTGNIVTNNIAAGNGLGFCTGSIWTHTFSGNVAENNGTGYNITGTNKRWEQLNNLLENNIARNNSTGIALNASYTTLRANTFSENDIGINFIVLHSYCTLRDNIVQDNRVQDIAFRWSWLNGTYGMMFGGSDCTTTIENTTGSGGRPIKYFNSAVDLRNEVLAGLILCNADGSTISDVTIAGSDTLNNNTLFLLNTDNATIRNVVSSDNRTGIYLSHSSNNLIENSITNANEDGIRLSFESSNNTIRNNSAGANTRTGIYIHHGSNPNITITGNTIANSLYGIVAEETPNSSAAGNTVMNTTGGMMLYYVQNSVFTNNTFRTSTYALDIRSSSGNLIYNNNFIDYLAPHYALSSDNTFNLARPVGGNYWSGFDMPSEGCSDLDHDGFCDAAYDLGGGRDHLPWAKENGWSIPTDTTPPATVLILSGITGSEGWYRSPVQIALNASDNEGGTGVMEIRTSIDGASETAWPGSSALLDFPSEMDSQLRYYAVDNANNAEPSHLFQVRIDLTPPTIAATVSPAPNAAGWNRDVAVSFSCADTLSQIAACTALVASVPEGRNQDVRGEAQDKAGNVATALVTLNVDRTPPSIVISGVMEGGSYQPCTVPVPAYTVSDALSGVAVDQATLTGGNENQVGSYIYSVIASDHAGNAASQSASFQIQYGFGGFAAPVTLEKPFKKGSTIPIKFILHDGCGSVITTARATLSLQHLSGGIPAGDPLEAVSTVPDAGSLFRYSATDGQYIYNLASDGLSVGTYVAIVSTNDGATRTVPIHIK